MKISLRKIAGAVAAFGMFTAVLFSGCTYEGAKNYYIVNSNDNKLDAAFKIDSFNTKNVKIYVTSDTVPYVVNGQDLEIPIYLPVTDGKEISDVPYISVDTILSKIMEQNYTKVDAGSTISYEKEICSNFPLIFDVENQTVCFTDYDEFTKRPSSATFMDLVS